MIITVLPPMVISRQQPAQLACAYEYESMYNTRYYRSFHGITSSGNSDSNEKSTARHKLTSVLSNKVNARPTSAGKPSKPSSPIAAGLLRETHRSNSSPCLDDVSPPDKSKLKSFNNVGQACPYAISRRRQVTNAIPSMYETSNELGKTSSVCSSVYSRKLDGSIGNISHSSVGKVQYGLKHRSISTSSSVLRKEEIRSGNLNGTSSNSLESLDYRSTLQKSTISVKSSKGNKVADLKSKFDSLSEKAKKEEIKPGVTNEQKVHASKSVATVKTVTKPACKKTPSVLKSSTMPDCSVLQRHASVDSSSKNDKKLTSVKQAVKTFERSISDDQRAINKSTNDLISSINEPPGRCNANVSKLNTAISHKSAQFSSPQTSHLHPAKMLNKNHESVLSSRSQEKSEAAKDSTFYTNAKDSVDSTPSVSASFLSTKLSSTKNLPVKNCSSLHNKNSAKPSDKNKCEKPILNVNERVKKSVKSAADGTSRSEKVEPVKKSFTQPSEPKQRKMLAKNISRANLGKAPEPPKLPASTRAPVPQPRKCWAEKEDHTYRNKNDCKQQKSVEKVNLASDKSVSATKLVINETFTKPVTSESRNSADKSKSLPNSSFLWNYKDIVASSNETIDTISVESRDPDQNRTDSGDYFEDPYVYNGDEIMEYASTSLIVDDEPIYMEANFLDSKRPPYHPPNEAVYASRDVTNLSSFENNKDSGESDEGWVDFSENELDHMTSNKMYHRSKTKKKIVNKKSNLKRLSWSHSFQKLNKEDGEEEEKSPSEDYQDVHDWDMNDLVSDTSCANSLGHQYEALYDIINQSSIVAEVGQLDRESNDSIPQLPKRDHSPLPNMKNKAISKDSGIGEYRSQTLEACLDDDISVDNTGIAKIAGEKIRRIKRNWSLTKSDIRLELSSRWNRMKPKKTSKSAAEIGVVNGNGDGDGEEPKSSDLKNAIPKKNSACTYSSPLISPSSPTKETAQFYLSYFENAEPSHSKCERPRSESYTLDCTSEQAKFVNNCRRVSLNRVSRPTVSPPLPPGDRPTYYASSTCRSSTSSSINSDSKSSLYDVIWSSSANDASGDRCKMVQNVKVLKSSSESCVPVKKETTANDDASSKSSLSSDTDSKICPPNISLPISQSSGSNPSIHHETSACNPSINHSNDHGHNKNEMSLSLNDCIRRKMSAENVPGAKDLRVSSTLSAPKSPVHEEPLYQFYQEHMRQRTSQWNNASDGSGSEPDRDYHYEEMCENITENCKPAATNRKMSAIEIVQSEVKTQTLWCAIPEVKASGLLDKLTSQEKKLQEAIFEVMTSEASYLKSMDILINHFMNCPEFVDEFSTECVLSRHERHVLFSDVLPVYEVSKRLLSAFEDHWQENVKLPNICEILFEHASKYFGVYVKYCSNQIYQDRQYKELKDTKPEFVEVLRKLESSPVCQNLSMHSFLMLPMQRITRLPLLVDAIYHRLEAETYLYDSSKQTLGCLNKIVADCNEGARKMERMEEMLRISQQINFKDCKGIPLISANRWLVKKGDLTKLNFSEASGKLSFGKVAKCSKVNVYLFLFTDLLIITKRKGDGTFAVMDYCPRNMVQVTSIEDESTLKIPCRLPEGSKNLFQFTMLQNHEGKTVDLLFCCHLESDRMRWMDAVTPPTSENPDEKIYEQWDCPQVQVVHFYQAQQPDELTLEESDVVNVFKKMADGWYQGERIRDGVEGWFPGNHTEEVVSSHVRAKNLRLRYRLLELSHSYLLKTQKSKSK